MESFKSEKGKVNEEMKQPSDPDVIDALHELDLSPMCKSPIMLPIDEIELALLGIQSIGCLHSRTKCNAGFI